VPHYPRTQSKGRGGLALYVNPRVAVPFFAQSKQRVGHRIYIGMLYTMKH
jgi:hypothetical protein